MSLILRKACQPILDKAGMQNFHIEMQEQRRMMSITTECGKSIVDVQGVNFSRVSPGKAEIEYAAELLESFIMKYKKDILKYVAAKDAYDAIPEIEMNPKDRSYSIKYQRILTLNGNDYNHTIEYKDSPLLITLNTLGGVTAVSLETSDKPINQSILLGKKLNRIKAKKAAETIVAYMHRKDELDKLMELGQKLNECKI